MKNRMSVHIEDREQMIWLPVLAMIDGIPQIGKCGERGGCLTEEEIRDFVDFCSSNNQNWCIAEFSHVLPCHKKGNAI